MKRLAKILAIVLVVLIIGGIGKSIIDAQAASPNDKCPVLGNHLITNIDPNVLVNLRNGYKNAGGSAECWISGSFLFRGPDLANQEQLDLFFKTAQEQKIQVVIRVASDNAGDEWDSIDTETAKANAIALNNAIGALEKPFPKNHTPFAYFGNEANLNNEWGGTANPVTYAKAFYEFATAAKNFEPSMSPLSYCGNTTPGANGCSSSGAGLNPDAFMTSVYQTLKTLVPGTKANRVDTWIKENIGAYTFIVIGPSADTIKTDFENEILTLSRSGFKDVSSKPLLISELGIPGGVFEPGIDKKLWEFYEALLSTPHGNQLDVVTTYVRDADGKIHAYYYVTNANGQLVASGEYNQASVNLGGSTSHKSGTTLGANSDIPSYPPLGSIQVCPPEIAVDSKFGDGTNLGPVSNSCGIIPHEEPKYCHDPSLIDKDNMRGDWCTGEELHRLCYPDSLPDFVSKGGYDCGGGADKTGNYGRSIIGFCMGQADDGTNNPIYQLWQKVYKGMQSNACVPLNEIPPKDQVTFGYCLKYYEHIGKSPNKNQTVQENIQGLPACVPTYNEKARCVSECGQPIQMGEHLQIGQITTTVGACLTDANCRAKIEVKGKDGSNSFFLPFAAKLGDYFAGVFDAEHQSEEDLDKLQQDLRDPQKAQQTMQKVWDQSGVARKILDNDTQDRLKCEFIQYVKDRKINEQNTKYLERIKGADGSYSYTGKEFQVFGKNITQISCPPEKSNGDLYTAWEKEFGNYWYAVPLFPNDASQGEIQFIAPSVFGVMADNSITGQEKFKTNDGKSAKYGPVYVSVPEVQRLALVTDAIQNALMPRQDMELRESLITSADPAVLQKNLPTYGKELDPKKYISPNACGPRDWEDFYSKSPNVMYDETKTLRIDGTNYQLDPKLGNPVAGLSEYERAVECKVDSISETSDSEICTVGPAGEIRCAQQDKAGGSLKPGVQNFDETVQVRTVFPHLFDIAENTIGAVGFLRVFKEQTEVLRSKEEADKAFDPIPASTDNVYYQVANSSGLSIDDTGHKETGWKLFFYKLGGFWNATNFVKQVLRFEGQPAGTGSTSEQTPH